MTDNESSVRGSRSLILVVFALVLACTFDYLFTERVPGISVVFFTLLIGLSLATLSLLFRRKLSRDVLLLLLLAMFFSTMVAVRANELLIVLNIFGTMLLLLLMTEINVRGTIQELVVEDYLKLAILPIRYLISFMETITTVRLPFSKSIDTTSKQIIRGTLITIPVIALFTVLFAGADPVFQRVLSNIVDLRFPLPGNPFVVFITFVAICGAAAYAFSKESAIKSAATLSKRPIGHIETAILLGSVNALFVIFIALQATYLFGGVANITNDAFTYAEYARRGFFELIAIAACTYLIMLATEKFIERNTEHHSRAFKYLSTALVIQVMVLMIFAFNRLSLYESAFGFTTLRLYSHAFIVLLAVVYLFLLFKIFIDTRENTFLLRVFFAVVVFVAGMNLLNPDAFIAQKNLERFEATGKIDFEYLARLSSDAFPILISIFERGDAIERSPLGRALYDRSIAPIGEWQSWNQSRESERELLQQHRATLEAYKDYEKPQVEVPVLD